MPEQDKFIKVYDECVDGIFRFCYFRTFDHELAKDLTQEAFTRTWQSMVNGQDISNIRAFVYKTARNLIIDNSRKKKSISLENVNIEEWGIHSSEMKHDGIDAGIVLKKMEQMSDKYREVIIMRYIQDLTPLEIAEILDETPNAVSIRLNRSIKQLRDLCQNGK